MKNFRNFLSIWSGALLLCFVVLELIEAGKVIVLNAKAAFEVTTDWRIVVAAMIFSAVLTLFIFILSKRKK